MKLFFTTALILASLAVTAQSYEDAIRFNTNNIQGTARSQAMGSAFGALGADLTSMLINPAGVGAYRKTELAVTAGYYHDETQTDYFGCERTSDRSRVPLYQIGVSTTMGIRKDREKGLICSSLAVSYSKLANYNRNVYSYDYNGYNSMLDYFCFDDVTYNEYSGQLAYDACLTEDVVDEYNNPLFTYNMWEALDEDGYLDPSMREDEIGGLVDHSQYIQERGFKGETTFAYGMNISNIVNIGVSIGIQSIQFKQTMNYSEIYWGEPREIPAEFMNVSYNAFNYYTDLRQNGTGVNFKIGAIVKPINALRIGIAFHSPTYFAINEKYEASIYPYIYGAAGSGKTSAYSPRGDYEYRYRTPSTIVASLAGVIGKIAIISADYETMNYEKGKFKNNEDDIWNIGAYDETNAVMKEALKRTHTLRLGAEVKIIDVLAVRGGYRFTSSPMEDGWLIHDYKDNGFSAGAGYRNSFFFADFAYVHNKKSTDHWVLPDYGDAYIYEENMPANVVSKDNNYLLTIGFRF